MTSKQAVQEISADVDITIRRDSVRLYLIGQESVDIGFSVVAAVSRAMNVVKESDEYAGWLTRKGLA